MYIFVGCHCKISFDTNPLQIYAKNRYKTREMSELTKIKNPCNLLSYTDFFVVYLWMFNFHHLTSSKSASWMSGPCWPLLPVLEPVPVKPLFMSGPG